MTQSSENETRVSLKGNHRGWVFHSLLKSSKFGQATLKGLRHLWLVFVSPPRPFPLPPSRRGLSSKSPQRVAWARRHNDIESHPLLWSMEKHSPWVYLAVCSCHTNTSRDNVRNTGDSNPKPAPNTERNHHPLRQKGLEN